MIQAEWGHAKPKKRQVNSIEYLDGEDEEQSSAGIAAVERDTDQYTDVAAIHAARSCPMPPDATRCLPTTRGRAPSLRRRRTEMEAQGTPQTAA